ncbi:hypothetical protein COS31_05005 [Candidatus Roizmanbacteria bacterium CG02_land_8_20_14_3_00_36_15]|uniref:Carbohydrate kinase PfkB domain-containing protein n=2 Tax=Candidatus Roizmaniibacteriota TaxID=1752723 RepID=A0A2M8KLA0_9BACT|nr:MAG: hypothetical protein COS51_05050 [Candidatus Roizmanbacteria bacterium CG03_land_8_20_14_0_80_36_21]PIV37376.1 MAG: hypothetical protein COS31_05005 [Candidatus Roizmanbacteria bacterium CG02_land_8_20_14_3_00_36_15]PIY70105.1 MAG: hypothetical protein COY89_02890 [Candidatus Roizmanbacteria bacterium CG_4_10_14_0_8_um_filter_36_36]PJA52711.1 MAG: hypothetical protein CO166_04620 [Candidatus Roizmanbacteria bacterium CG_4_9_14_3_um_filter_36_11]PJC81379.1 MAG: hypothetical protein CO007
MYDFISTGSISIDLYFSGKSFTFSNQRFQLAVGGKYMADHFYTGLGGGGANVAIGVRRQGWRSAIIGIVGNNPFKKIILSKLKKEKVSDIYCDFIDNYYNISAVLLTEKGERSIIHYISPHRHLFSNNNRLRGITKSRFLYLGNLPDVSLTEREIFLNFFKKKSVMTAVNLGVTDCRRSKNQLKPFLDNVNILILNGHEFAELVKSPYKDINFKDDVISWYIPYLRDQIVVVTEGSKGSFVYYLGKIYYQKADKPEKIVDTTGAGDAYTSGFLSQYLKSKDIGKSMYVGTKYATKILMRVGAN